MKDLVDKSMGIVTHITEALTRIKPTESLRLDKREPDKKRNWSDSSGNSPVKILASRCACKKSSRAKCSLVVWKVFGVGRANCSITRVLIRIFEALSIFVFQSGQALMS